MLAERARLEGDRSTRALEVSPLPSRHELGEEWVGRMTRAVEHRLTRPLIERGDE
jgi:hypothetical protein